MNTKFSLGNTKNLRQLGDITVDGRTVVKSNLKEMGHEGVNWIELTDKKVQWLVPVNTVMDTLVT
jgi:hypothetical protein